MKPRSVLSLVIGAALSLSIPAAAAPREFVIANPVLLEAHMEANVEAFVRRLEQVAGWRQGTIKAKAFNRPNEAMEYIAKNKVPFAILPVQQFVQHRKALKLGVLGRAVGIEGTTIAYWGVTRNEKRPYERLEAHPGLTLAVTDASDPQWIKVLFEKEIDPKTHFKYLEVPSDKEAIASVLAKKADVALVYELEFQGVKERIENKKDLGWAYTSGALPPPPVVAVGKFANKADAKRVHAALPKMCKGEGADLCARVAVVYMQQNMGDSYVQVVHKYETY